MSDYSFSFEKLEVWQLSRQYVKTIYLLLQKFPSEERYALCDQIRRAVVSIPSNIAEGSGRKSFKEKIHFLDIAYGSLMECYCQMQLSADFGYISEEELRDLKSQSVVISRLLNALSSSFEKNL